MKLSATQIPFLNLKIKQIKRRWWITGRKTKQKKGGRRNLQLTQGHTQQQGCDQQDWAGRNCPCAVVMTTVAVTLVGPVTVIAKAAMHLGSGSAAVSLLTEGLVCARLHNCVWKRSGQRGWRVSCVEVTEDFPSTQMDTHIKDVMWPICEKNFRSF